MTSKIEKPVPPTNPYAVLNRLDAPVSEDFDASNYKTTLDKIVESLNAIPPQIPTDTEYTLSIGNSGSEILFVVRLSPAKASLEAFHEEQKKYKADLTRWQKQEEKNKQPEKLKELRAKKLALEKQIEKLAAKVEPKPKSGRSKSPKENKLDILF